MYFNFIFSDLIRVQTYFICKHKTTFLEVSFQELDVQNKLMGVQQEIQD